MGDHTSLRGDDPLNYETVLYCMHTLWACGEWEKIIIIDHSKFANHPKYSQILIIIAGAYIQLGKITQFEFHIELVKRFWIDKHVAARVLLSSIFNSMGRIKALNENIQTSSKYFEESINIYNQNSNTEFLIKNRIENEFKLLGLNSKDKPDQLFPDDFEVGKETWTSIICMWKRTDYIERQLENVRAQKIPPIEIIIVINESHIDVEWIKKIAGPEVKIIKSEINSLYLRWSISYIARGDYICVFDDDTIPDKAWVENAIRASKQYNAIVGPSGRIYDDQGKHGFFKYVGPDEKKNDHLYVSAADSDIVCDWICNSYLFKRKWVSFALADVRYLNSEKTYDDIQLCFSLRKYGGIKCVVPMQKKHNGTLGSTNPSYNSDEYAMWKNDINDHFLKRKKYVEDLIKKIRD